MSRPRAKRERGGEAFQVIAEHLRSLPQTDIVTIGTDWTIEHRRDDKQFPYHLMEGAAFRGRFIQQEAAVLTAFQLDNWLTLADVRAFQ